MEQKLMITSLPQAFKMIKEMNLSAEWDSDYREAGRRALQRVGGQVLNYKFLSWNVVELLNTFDPLLRTW